MFSCVYDRELSPLPACCGFRYAQYPYFLGSELFHNVIKAAPVLLPLQCFRFASRPDANRLFFPLHFAADDQILMWLPLDAMAIGFTASETAVDNAGLEQQAQVVRLGQQTLRLRHGEHFGF